MVESSSPVQGRHAAVSFAQRDGRTEFRLVFSEGPNVELLETWFTHPLTHQPLKSTRGKTADSKDTGTFGWTNAVRALCLLFIRHKLSAFRDNTCNRMAITAGISGPRGSLAASLGYAISKEPLWLQEMFGLDSKGTSILKRLLKRSNPELKRPGPTSVSVNESIVRRQSISIYVGSLPVEAEAELQSLLFGLERSTEDSPKVAPTSSSSSSVSPPPPMPGLSGEHLFPKGGCHKVVQDRFFSEASWALQAPEIFSRDGYQGALKQISIDPSFRQVCPSFEQFNVMPQRSLPTNVLQGLLTRELGQYCQRMGRPLRLGITPAQVASIAILTQMQREGIDLEIDFGFSLSEDLLGLIRDDEGPLDGFVVTIASAAALLAMKDTEFVPLSLMPKISHAVIRKNEVCPISSKNIAGRFLMVSDGPSTPQFCLDSLIRRGRVPKKEVALRFANPSDVTRKIMQEDSDEMTILGFPHYSLLELVDGLTLVDDISRDDMSKGAVMFVRRSIAKDEKFALAILGHLRSSWLSLAHSPRELGETVQAILHNREYTRSLGLTIGAHHFLGPRNAIQSN